MTDEHKTLTIAKTTRHPATDAPHAPFVFFDAVPATGVMEGIVTATLTAGCMLPAKDGTGLHEYPVVVAYLRCNRGAALALRDAIDGALLMGSVPQGGAN